MTSFDFGPTMIGLGLGVLACLFLLWVVHSFDAIGREIDEDRK